MQIKDRQLTSKFTSSVPVEGRVTTFQNGGIYRPEFDVPSDSVMVYADTVNHSENQLRSWSQNNAAGRSIDIMISANRAINEGEYNGEFGGKAWELQRKINPDPNAKEPYIRIEPHGVPYIIPTENFLEYKWHILSKHCKDYTIGMIAIEEPEIWRSSGYSDAFRAEWEAYYHEPWQDQRSSPLAMYKSSRLKVALWERFLGTLARRLKEAYPGIEVLVATHSLLSYNAIGIIAGTSHYTALDGIDGIIGQTWSNTVAVPVAYEGEHLSRRFESGYIGYASFVGALSPTQKLYALADPYADYAHASWEYYEDTYKKTVVAQLLQPSIHRFEETLWLDRSFNDKVPSHYRTLQLSVFNALQRLSGRESRQYGGTQGIGVAISDTLSWQWSEGIVSKKHTNNGFYGVTIPLVERGIPLTLPCLDKLESLEDLKDVRLLVVCYDILKPLKERTHALLAEWVRQGGVLLSIGGLDETSSMPGWWWGEKGQTPLENLLEHLGLSSRWHMKSMDGPVSLCSDIPAFDGAQIAPSPISRTLEFSEEEEGFLRTAQGQAVGVQAAVGKGTFAAVGLPSDSFSAPGGADRMRALIDHALSLAEIPYEESPLLAIERGEITAAQALGQPVTLQGRYLDLFDPALPIIIDPTLAAEQSALLLELSAASTPGFPRYAHGGGRLCSAVEEEPNRTAFTLAGPKNSATATRLLGNGLALRSVTVDGQENGSFATAWDDQSGSLLLTIQHQTTDTVVVEILWGEA